MHWRIRANGEIIINGQYLVGKTHSGCPVFSYLGWSRLQDFRHSAKLDRILAKEEPLGTPQIQN